MRSIFVVHFALWFAFNGTALASCSFVDQFASYFISVPSEIQRNPTAVRRAGESSLHGKSLSSVEYFNHLPDGEYIYLIDQEHGVTYSSRVPDLTAENPLITHRALGAYFEKNFGRAPRVLAAGEFYIDHGIVSYLNNKARTWRGNQANLVYAEGLLRNKRLPIQPDTKRIDYSTESVAANHAEELTEAMAQKRLLTNEKIKDAVQVTLLKRARMARRFPGEIAGTIHWDDYDDLKRLKFPRKPGQFPSREEQWIELILQRMDKHDVPYFTMELALKELGEERFIKMLENWVEP